MKTKEMEVGKLYAIRRGNDMRAHVGMLITKDPYKAVRGRTSYVRHMPAFAQGAAVPANKDLGERGGLAFAIRSDYSYATDDGTVDATLWTPMVVQPGAVFATAESYEALLAEANRIQAEKREREYALYNLRRGWAWYARHAIQVQHGWTNARLRAAGLPTVQFDRWSNNPTVRVDNDFLQQVLEKVGALSTNLGTAKSSEQSDNLTIWVSQTKAAS